MMEITLFYITNASKESASKLGHEAIEKKLAACANIFPVQSIFPWDNEMQSEDECVLILKTIPFLKNDLTTFIISRHPYEVPCIINWNVEVNDNYGDWIKQNVL